MEPKKALDDANKIKEKAISAITKKIAASGGIIGFLVWILTQITPLGSAIKGAVAAWKWDAGHPNNNGELKVFNVINEDDRYKNSISIRDEMQRIYPKVVGVGFFVIDEEIDTTSFLRYITDSGASPNTPEGQEIWFYDLNLSRDEFKSLSQFDCIFREKGAYFPGNPDVEKKEKVILNVVLCPVIKSVPDKRNKNLQVFTLNGVAGVAIRDNNLEPYAGMLFKYTPNLNNIQ